MNYSMTTEFITNANITLMPIDQIIIGQRRRQKLGNIQALANSIGSRGLLHPIIVQGRTLISGQRRLEACKKLGWKTIPVRRIETMAEEEMREIELEENTERLALADFEISKARLAQIRQAEAELKARAEEDSRLDHKHESGKRPRGGQRKAGSKRDIAAQTGISPAAQVQIEKHVSLGEQFPFMQRNGWVQHQVLEAGAELEKIPRDERGRVAALLDQDAIPPRKSIEIISNMAQMPASDRKEVFKLAESNSPHDRTTALTKAAKLPPPPDPALSWLRDAKSSLKRAAEVCVTGEFIQPLQHVFNLCVELENRFTRYVRKNQQ